jgi:hypothetical protein
MLSRIECPRCGGYSANFVKGLCRACYMRDHHQRRSAAAVTAKQRLFETSTLIGDSAGQRLCVECKAPGLYAHGLCRHCYMRDRQHRQRQRHCVECGGPGIYARGLCQNCYLRDYRRHHRIKLLACAVCAVSFQSVRRDALYCSSSCRQKAHRVGKAKLFGMAAHVGGRGAVQSAIEMQATLAPRSEVQAHAPVDLGRRQVDSIIKGAANRRRTNAIPSAIDGRRKVRQMLAGGRRGASTSADLKAERATLGAKGRQIEAGATAIRHVAEPICAETDSERTIRWLLALMMMWCDTQARPFPESCVIHPTGLQRFFSGNRSQ